MTQPFSPCSEHCKTPEWCFEDGGCGANYFAKVERHDEEPDDFICPESVACPTQASCDSRGLCLRQHLLPSA